MCKKKDLYQLLLTLFFLLLLSTVYAQTTSTITDTVVATTEEDNYNEEEQGNDTAITQDSYVYTIRSIPPDSLLAIKKEKSFSYMNNLDSLLRERNKELIRQLESLSGKKQEKPEFSFDFVRMALWILAAGALLYLIYALFLGNNTIFRSYRKNIDTSFEEDQGDENIPPSSLKAKALAAGNYRLAVRYSYLDLLELLSSKKIIERRTDKTNYQYVNELRQQPWVNAFASVTLKYEYIWYGKYEIDKNIYTQVETEFEGLKQKIK